MSKRREKQEQLGGWQERLLVGSQAGRKGYRGGESGRGAMGERVRVRVIWLLMAIAVVALTGRLTYLTVFEQGRQRLLSDENKIERVREYASRGVIVDREGRELVVNHPEKGERGREYLLGEAGAHLLGYLSEVTVEELGCTEGTCYSPGEWIGRSGVERVFESTLKGRDGGSLREVNARGEMVRELGANEAEPGQELVLSVDKGLQEGMVEAMGERIGSAVALDMQGKVLGLYSNPSYNPNLFTLYPNEEAKQALLLDEEREIFLNRAIGGAYAPGSVFKLVTAYAGLESGKIDKDTLIEDTGEIRIDQYRYGNWYFDQYGRKEGEINVERALARSNDVFFYKVGERVGVDELVKRAREFGLGEETGIELPGEVAGLVPSRLWKERVTGERWFLGNTYHLAIGQGDLTATPLQIARMTLAAVSGRKCRVSVLRESKVECTDLGLKSENIEVVRAGMRGVCAVGGTAFPFFDFAPYALCKTGTAEHAGQNPSASSGPSGEEVLPHAWITLAYPGENPEMILTVMLEAAGEGSYEAAPVAREILEKWRAGRN